MVEAEGEVIEAREEVCVEVVEEGVEEVAEAVEVEEVEVDQE